jgi:hypothetical protein
MSRVWSHVVIYFCIGAGLYTFSAFLIYWVRAFVFRL